MSNPIFDELIEIIINSNAEIWNNSVEKIPSIFYIGWGKSGSQSICNGFPKHKVAHWHNVGHFTQLYKSNLLSKNKYDLYDFIIYIGKKYNFKPLIIESIRDPVERNISAVFQTVEAIINGYTNKMEDLNNPYMRLYNILKSDISEDSKKQVLNIILAKKLDLFEILSTEMWEKHYNIDLKTIFDKEKSYCYSNQTTCNLLLLRYDNIKDWKEIFSNIGYDYVPNHTNNTLIKPNNIPLYYDYVLRNISYEKKNLETIYFNYQPFYNKNDLDNFYKRWLKPT